MDCGPHDERIVRSSPGSIIKSGMEWAGARPALTIALTALSLYLSTPTANYYWDGLAFASQIEDTAKHLRPASLLLHQNHLMYNLVGYVLYEGARVMCLRMRCLYVLQLASAVCGSIGVGLFLRITESISGSRRLAVIAAASLGVSTCWWRAATDADAYMVSATLVLVCADIMLKRQPRWYWAGAVLAGAMLVHELAVLFFPAVLVLVAMSDAIEDKLKFAVKLSLTAWGITVLAYYICGAAVLGITNPVGTIEWAATNPNGVALSNPLETLWTFPKYQFDLILGHSLRAFFRFGGPAETGLAITGIAAASLSGWFAIRSGRAAAEMPVSGRGRKERFAVGLILAWSLPYSLFLLIWEPYLLHYRVYYVPPIVLGLALGFARSRFKAKNSLFGAAAIAVAALGLLNLAFFIGPFMHEASDPLVAAARAANSKWNERTVIYSAGPSVVDGAFRYFNAGAEWRGVSLKVIRRLDPEIESIRARGGSVWINDATIKLIEPGWLTEHGRGQEMTIRLGNECYRYLELLPAN